VDGLRPDIAERELAAGRLPHLARLARRGGAARAVTAFPSTTSVAYLPFLTGCAPGRCNVPSIRWLDRARYDGRPWRSREHVRSYCGYQAGRLDGDIAPDVRTVFELVPESTAVFTMVARGLTPDRDPSRRARKLWGTLAHFTEWHQPSDDAVARHLLRAAREPWRFVFAQFPAVDGYTHQSTPDGPRVLRALRRVDAAIGALLDTLESRGESERALVLVVSDHGASPVHTHLDLADWFRAQGVPTLAHPIIWTRNPGAAVMVAGNGSAMVYARPGMSRAERWPLERLRTADAFGAGRDLVAALVREPAVAFVAGETTRPDGAEGALRLLSADGDAEIVRRGEYIAYVPRTGDPLAIDSAFEGTAREWVARTIDSPYPDAPGQLLDQFRSPRTGDLVVVAREGYDFRERFEVPEHKAGHGSLVAGHMLTPLIASEPLPEAPLRTVDLFPAMLDWLGVPLPAVLDGEPVWLPATEPVTAAGVGCTGPARMLPSALVESGP
jgi:hypothetical protein